QGLQFSSDPHPFEGVPAMSLFRAQFRRALRLRSSSALLLFFLPSIVWAQSASPSGTSAPAPSAPGAPQTVATPSITTTVDEVSLDLIVRTKSNKPILDLKNSDFA